MASYRVKGLGSEGLSKKATAGGKWVTNGLQGLSVPP